MSNMAWDIMLGIVSVIGLVCVGITIGYWKRGIEKRLDELQKTLKSDSLAMNVIITTFTELGEKMLSIKKVGVEDVMKAIQEVLAKYDDCW